MCHIIEANRMDSNGITGIGEFFPIGVGTNYYIAGLKTLNLSDGGIRPVFRKDKPFSYIKPRSSTIETGDFFLKGHKIFAFYPFNRNEIRTYQDRKKEEDEFPVQEVQFRIPVTKFSPATKFSHFPAGIHIYPVFLAGTTLNHRGRLRTFIDPCDEMKVPGQLQRFPQNLTVFAIFRLNEILFYDGMTVSVKRFFIINSRKWYEEWILKSDFLQDYLKNFEPDADLIKRKIRKLIDSTYVLIKFLRGEINNPFKS